LIREKTFAPHLRRMKLVRKFHHQLRCSAAPHRICGFLDFWAKDLGKPSQQIEVTDSELNITTNYNSVKEAASALNIKQSRISRSQQLFSK